MSSFLQIDAAGVLETVEVGSCMTRVDVASLCGRLAHGQKDVPLSFCHCNFLGIALIDLPMMSRSADLDLFLCVEYLFVLELKF